VHKGRKGHVVDPENLARNAIEEAGFKVHDANILFHANCPNIDLVVYGKEQAIYVQVKSSRKPAGKDGITVDGSPWTEEQLYQNAGIYNKRDGFMARLIVLVDLATGDSPTFYIAPPVELERIARKKGKTFASKLKRDGTKRVIGFRKELSREELKPWLNAWHLLGEPLRQSDRANSTQPKEDREWVDAPRIGRELL
jgi:Holliday junction resolvase-like predicted endonuclease